MTESRILELLLDDQPADVESVLLKRECVGEISAKLADSIYESLKFKSAASNESRYNILKLVQHWCSEEKNHLTVNESNCDIFISNIDKHVYKEDSDIGKFLKFNSLELANTEPANFPEELLMFYSNKNKRKESRNVQLEFVYNLDNERIKNSKVNTYLSKYVAHSKTNEVIIKNIFKYPLEQKPSDANAAIDSLEVRDKNFRKSQIAYCYALMNLKKESHYLKKVLSKLSEYEVLMNNERQFLIYYLGYLGLHPDITEYFLQNFPFTWQTVFINICSDIIKCPTRTKYLDLIKSLKSDSKFINIQKCCHTLETLNLQVKCFLYELYCYSFCNQHILEFITYFFE